MGYAKMFGLTWILRVAIVAGIAATALVPQLASAQVDRNARSVYGTIVAVDLARNLLKFKRRNGTTIVVDIAPAAARDQLGPLPLDTGVVLSGVRGPDGVFHVQSIGHAAPRAIEWRADSDR